MNMTAESILQSYLAVTQMGETLELKSTLTRDTIAWEKNGDLLSYIYIYKNTGIEEVQEVLKSINKSPLFVISEKWFAVDDRNVLVLSLDQLKTIVSELKSYSYEEKKTLLKGFFGELEYQKLYGLLTTFKERSSNIKDKNLAKTTSIKKKQKKTNQKNTVTKSMPDIPESVQVATLSAIEDSLGLTLSKGKNQYYYGQNDTCVLLVFSKTYHHGNSDDFWYGFHKKQKEELEKHKNSYIAYGCYEEDFAFLIPLQVMCELLENFKTTINDKAYYWHIKIFIKQGQEFFKIKNGERYDLESSKITTD